MFWYTEHVVNLTFGPVGGWVCMGMGVCVCVHVCMCACAQACTR